MSREKLNPEKIASIFGVSVSSVNSWRYGKNFPDVPNLIKLLELGLAPSDFLPGALHDIAILNDNKSEILELSKYIEEHEIAKTENESLYKNYCFDRLGALQTQSEEIEQRIEAAKKNQ